MVVDIVVVIVVVGWLLPRGARWSVVLGLGRRDRLVARWGAPTLGWREGFTGSILGAYSRGPETHSAASTNNTQLSAANITSTPQSAYIQGKLAYIVIIVNTPVPLMNYLSIPLFWII